MLVNEGDNVCLTHMEEQKQKDRQYVEWGRQAKRVHVLKDDSKVKRTMGQIRTDLPHTMKMKRQNGVVPKEDLKRERAYTKRMITRKRTGARTYKYGSAGESDDPHEQAEFDWEEQKRIQRLWEEREYNYWSD